MPLSSLTKQLTNADTWVLRNRQRIFHESVRFLLRAAPIRGWRLGRARRIFRTAIRDKSIPKPGRSPRYVSSAGISIRQTGIFAAKCLTGSDGSAMSLGGEPVRLECQCPSISCGHERSWLGGPRRDPVPAPAGPGGRCRGQCAARGRRVGTSCRAHPDPGNDGAGNPAGAGARQRRRRSGHRGRPRGAAALDGAGAGQGARALAPRALPGAQPRAVRCPAGLRPARFPLAQFMLTRLRRGRPQLAQFRHPCE
jgi:hypothetical protein